MQHTRLQVNLELHLTVDVDARRRYQGLAVGSEHAEAHIDVRLRVDVAHILLVH